MTQLLYRGVAYDSAHRDQPTATPLQHTYRGHLYSAPLLHEAAAPNPDLELHYRGHVYHQGEELAGPHAHA